MTHQVSRTALFLIGLLVVIILALRLLPNDDASIRTLLLPPEGCAAPCFMNVRAGVTDSIEAAQLISKHVWAKSPPFFARSMNDMYMRYVIWQWSGQQPIGVDTSRQGQMQIYKGHASSIIFRTTLSLGAIWLVLGKTTHGTLSLSEVRSATDMMIVIVYPEQGLLVRVVVPKNTSPLELWKSLAEIESSNAQAIAYFGGYNLPVLARLRAGG